MNVMTICHKVEWQVEQREAGALPEILWMLFTASDKPVAPEEQDRSLDPNSSAGVDEKRTLVEQADAGLQQLPLIEALDLIASWAADWFHGLDTAVVNDEELKALTSVTQVFEKALHAIEANDDPRFTGETPRAQQHHNHLLLGV